MSRLQLSSAIAALWVGLHGFAVSADTTDRQTELHGTALDSELSLSFVGLSSEAARLAGAEVLAEVERLEALLSTRQTDSELMQLNQRGSTDRLSPELAQVLQQCEAWRSKTANAFSCRLGRIEAIWRQTSGTGEAPDRSALRRSALEIHAADWNVSQAGVRLQGIQLEPGALSQGWIVDSALARARNAAPEATGIKVQLGDVAAYWGVQPMQAGQPQPWQVAIESQHAAGDGYYGTLQPDAQAVAFSDPRDRLIGERRFSYIIDPADGWPVEFAPSAVVVAPDAATASTLATALAAMPINQGLALIDRLPGTEALVITETGKTFASQGWYPLLQASDGYQPRWDRHWEFVVEYQIPRQPEAEYRRPYAAVWITDTDNELVRQLAVHGDNPRWLKDLSLWWRRYGRRDAAAIDGLTRATPVPGRHSLAWDGRDEQGRSVADGSYVLHIEAAREHGGRERIALPFQLSSQTIEQQVQGQAELGMISVRFAAARTDSPARPHGNAVRGGMAAVGSRSSMQH